MGPLLWLVILFVLAVGVIVFFIKACVNHYWGDHCWAIACWVGMIICVVVGFRLFEIDSNHYNNSTVSVWVEKEIGKTEIVALGDNLSVQGQLFLGSGSIHSEIVYVYAVKTGEDSFRLSWISMNDVIEVVQTDKIKPCIVAYKWELNPPHNHWFWSEKEEGRQQYFGQMYRIFVPKGTINLNFKVDLQ